MMNPKAGSVNRRKSAEHAQHERPQGQRNRQILRQYQFSRRNQHSDETQGKDEDKGLKAEMDEIEEKMSCFKGCPLYTTKSWFQGDILWKRKN